MTTATAADYLAAADALDLRTGAYIGGRFVAAQSGRRFDDVSPRDGRVIAHIAEGADDDIDAAVASARAAFDSGEWSRRSPKDRRLTLLRLAALLSDHREELALLESLDMGKPVADALSVDLRVTIETFEFFGEAINKVYDEVAPTPSGTLATITREPVGVVGAVVPWNFPLMMAAWKVAPALAAGNSVVLKPAEQSPLSALRLAELATEAGLPDGVLNVVPGFGPTAGAALGLHNEVDALAFTGSGEVGRCFLRYSADSNMKQVTLECGGKSPQIVFADAPELSTIVDAVCDGIFYNQGEVCSAGSRLLVHTSRKDELLDALVAAAAQRVPGDPLDPSTQTGALVEAAHLERVLGYVDAGIAEGARLVSGGRRVREETGGFYIEPTIFDDVSSSMRIAQEEIFGPVLAVFTFQDDAEAVALANDTVFGLAAAVWSNSLSTALTTAREIRAGTVWVNNYEGGDITVPFGGYRQSGFGRDKSLHALDKYTQLKTTWIAYQ
jgi:acyl-CoA reductase-like NAD-dependent aldehyde dehydrogenase